MKRLLLGIFASIAINVQGQSIEEPITINNYCDFIFSFADEHYFYTVSDDNNKKDCTISIYNDGLRNVKTMVAKNVLYDQSQPVEVGATVHSLIRCDIKHAHYEGGEESFLTQTLFNNDHKWEYVRGTFILTIEKNDNYERKVFKLTKAEIVNEDGKVLAEIPIDAIDVSDYLDRIESYFEVVRMGENNYLYREADKKDQQGNTFSIFYKISPNGDGSGVEFTKAAEFKGYPNPVRQNDTFTIEVGDENVATGNFIEVCDQKGRLVYRQAITSSQVKIPMRRMKGMYIYNIVSGGHSINTGKVIVR